MDMFKSVGALAAVIVPIVTAVAAFVKYYRNSKDSHARVMLELIREFQHEHADTFYALVERKESEFYCGDLVFDSTENERKADALLLFMENILYLHTNGTISDSEIIHFEYYLKRIIGDPDFAHYLHDFGAVCSDGGTVNPFAHVLNYCRSQAVFNKWSMRAEDTSGSRPTVERSDKNDGKAASEDVFITYLTQYYQSMTRTAKSVKSRVDSYFQRKGWLYEQAPTKDRLLTAIKTVGDEVKNPNSAASMRAALRQYYRASFGEELMAHREIVE